MRCTYYLDAATPYHRGSAEIVNMVHMAMRAHMGLPVRNVHFVHVLDRAALTSLNHAEFRQKYLSECHPKFTEQGEEIQWDVFEEMYDKNNAKEQEKQEKFNKDSEALSNKIVELSLIKCGTWADLALTYFSLKDLDNQPKIPINIRAALIMNDAKILLQILIKNVDSLHDDMLPKINIIDAMTEEFIAFAFDAIWRTNKLEAPFFTQVYLRVFPRELNTQIVIRIQDLRKAKFESAPYLAVLEAACFHDIKRLQTLTAKDPLGKRSQDALAFLDAPSTPRDPAIESSPARALLQPGNTRKPTISTSTLQQREDEKATGSAQGQFQKTDEAMTTKHTSSIL